MRKMKYSGIDSIGDIPADWKVQRLKTILKLRSEKNSGDRELLSVYLDRGVISYNDSSGMQVHKPSADLSNYQNVHVGDFVLNNQQAWRGSVGVSKYDGIISPAYFVYELTGECDSTYMNFLLRDGSMVQQYETSSRGVGTIQRNLYALWFLNTLVILPPIQEQIRIGKFLYRKCTAINSIATDIQSQIDVLEQYRCSIITEAVTNGLNPDAEMKDSGYDWVGMMPSTWVMRKGKYMFVQRSLRGNSIELQLLSPTQKFGVIPQSLYEELTGMSAVKLSEKADLSLLKTIHKGDFCISLRSFQGGFEYSEYEGVVSPAYQVFYPTVEIADGYYRYLFKESGFIEKMNSYTMTLRDGKNIAFADFGNTYIPYPPVEEQAAIADFLDAKVSEIDGIIDQKKEQLEVLDSYKKSLIYEYVTGKKSVPLTEPAIETVMIDPHVILAGMVIDLLGDKLKGKTQIQKLLYLFDSHLGLNLATQYYRYKHGPYDLSLDHYLNVLVENGWFKKVPGDAEKYEKGSNHAEFCDKYKDAFAQHSGKINSLVSFVKDMKRTSQIERIATIFAVWNDLILDGNRTPTDDEIIHEILTHWTPNKANTAEGTWKGTLDKMRKQGIIPKGWGLHTLPMPSEV